MIKAKPNHQHHWNDLPGSDYHPPADVEFHKSRGLSGWRTDQALAFVRRAAAGYTIFHQRCDLCGEVQTCEVPGRFTPQPA